MASQPGSDEIAALREDIKSGIADLGKKLEAEAVTLRNDVNQARLLRAENYATYMRNWLALLTFTVTLAFAGFGILGYTRFSDIEAYRKQMVSDAADVRKNANTVSDAANTVQHVMGDLKDRVADLDTKTADIKKRIDEIESRAAEAESRNKAAEKQIATAVNNTSAVAQQTRNDLQSGISSGMFGLDIPYVSEAHLEAPPAVSTISGRDFGNSPGRVYAEVQRGPLTITTLQPSTRIEIDSSFTWTDTSISFVLSGETAQKLRDLHEKESTPSSSSEVLGPTISSSLSSYSYLTLRVVNSEGKSSISFAFVSWP